MGERAAHRRLALRLHFLEQGLAVPKALPTHEILLAPDPGQSHGLPAARGFLGLGGVPGPARTWRMIDDDRLGCQRPRVGQHGVRIGHFMQAEFEEHDIAGVDDRLELLLTNDEPAAKSHGADGYLQALHRRGVRIDRDDAARQAGVADELPTSGADVHRRLFAKIVESGQVRQHERDVCGHLRSSGIDATLREPFDVMVARLSLHL